MTSNLQWLQDPTVFCVNRLNAHSDHVHYGSVDEIKSNETSFVESLNGVWQFYYSDNFSVRPKDFYKDNFDMQHFGQIEVPSHIELQGYGQIQYINTMYPWDGRLNLRPPNIEMSENPVGSYVKCFDLNDNFKGKRV